MLPAAAVMLARCNATLPSFIIRKPAGRYVLCVDQRVAKQAIRVGPEAPDALHTGNAIAERRYENEGDRERNPEG